MNPSHFCRKAAPVVLLLLMVVAQVLGAGYQVVYGDDVAAAAAESAAASPVFEIVSWYPPDGSTNISVYQEIGVRFSAPVDTGSIGYHTASDTMYIQKVGDSTHLNAWVYYAGDLNELCLKPTWDLLPGTTYQVTLTEGIRSQDGQHLAQRVTCSFTTAGSGPSTSTTPPNAGAFSDVSSAHPYYLAISDLYGRGFMGGYADGTFRPNSPLQRQQYAKMAVLTLGYEVTASDVSTYPDTPAPYDLVNNPLYPGSYVAVASANGIIAGYSNGNFGFADYLTRQQAITIAVRAANNALGTPSPGWAGTLDYSDPTHGANIRKAEYNGLLAGLPLAGFNLSANVTRGEVAQVLHNLLIKLGDGNGSIGVPQSVEVLTSAQLSALESVSSDRSVLVFSSSSAPSLAPGDVIVAGVSATTPTGLLRKVVSVSSSSIGITVQTAAATLQEAIPEGSFTADVTLAPSSVQASSSAPIAASGGAPLGASAVTGNLGTTVSYGDMSFGVGKVSLSGSTYLSQPPTAKFSANWTSTGGLHSSVLFSARQTTTLTATASPGSTGSRSWDILPTPQTFAPITVMVGALPVVLVPTLQWQVEVSVGVSDVSTVSQSVVQNTTLTAGLDVDVNNNGQVTRVTPTSSLDCTFSNSQATPGILSSNLRVSVGPVITLALYGVAGPSLNADGFLDLSVRPTDTPWWVLSGGVQAGVGLNVPLLKLSVSNPDLVQWSKTILQASGPAMTKPKAPTMLNLELVWPQNYAVGWWELRWKDNSDNEEGFNVYAGYLHGGSYTWTLIDRTDSGTTSYVLSSAIANADAYKVTAHNAAGESSPCIWEPTFSIQI